MKKLTKLAIVFSVGLVLINSCSKESLFEYHKANIESNSQNAIEDSIGYWHNIAMENIYDKDDNTYKQERSYKTIRTNIIGTLNNQEGGMFNPEKLKELVQQSDLLLDQIGMISEKRLIINEERINNIFLYLQKQNEISYTLCQELIRLNGLAHNSSMSQEDFIKEVQKVENYNIGQNDSKYIDVIVQVTIHSQAFWAQAAANNGGGNGDDTPTECTLCIIWADAAGAAYGLILGPIGSIIEVALFSSIAAIQ